MQTMKKSAVHILCVLGLAIMIFSACLFILQPSVHAATNLKGTTSPNAYSCGPGGSVVFNSTYQVLWYKGAGFCDVNATDLIDAVGVQALPLGGSWHYVAGPYSRSCSDCISVYNPGPGPTQSYLYNIRDASNYRVVETGSYQIGSTRGSYGDIIWQLR